MIAFEERKVGKQFLFPSLVETRRYEKIESSWGLEAGVKEYRIDWEEFDFLKERQEKLSDESFEKRNPGQLEKWKQEKIAKGEKPYEKSIYLPKIYENILKDARFHIPALNLCEIFRQWNAAYTLRNSPSIYINDSIEIDQLYDSAIEAINIGFKQIAKFMVVNNESIEKFNRAYGPILSSSMRVKFWHLQTGGGNLPEYGNIIWLKKLCTSTTTIIQKDGTKTINKDLGEKSSDKIKEYLHLMHENHFFFQDFDDIKIDESRNNFTIDHSYMVTDCEKDVNS